MAANDPRVLAASIVARIESLPFSTWDLRIAASVGAATFFDAFDALTIAFVLPSIIHEWHLSTFNAAELVSAGYAGQAVGAVIVAALAERYGRVPALVAAVAALGICSLICASTHNFAQLLVARFAQGIGLGGEVPVAAAYLSEMIRFDRRGKIFMFYQSTFGIGITAASIVRCLKDVPVRLVRFRFRSTRLRAPVEKVGPRFSRMCIWVVLSPSARCGSQLTRALMRSRSGFPRF